MSITNPRKITSVFFRAILAGYLGKVMPDGVITKTEENGFKVLTYREGDFTVVDRYTENFGDTVVYFNDKPIWKMNYQGYYDKRALPTLFKALEITYTKEEFVGGRGPRCFKDGTFFYENYFEGDATHFTGRERISETDEVTHETVSIGYHEYSGMMQME